MIRPLRRDANPKGLVEWNDEGGWRSEFATDLTGALFFAETLLGWQFALRENAVWQFDPDGGEWSLFAPTVRGWAESLLDEERQPQLESPLAKRWQAKHGEIPDGTRLRPPVPLIFKESADATLDDYRPIPEDEVMGALATVVNAIQDLPDGTQVRLRTTKRRWWWPFPRKPKK